MKNAIYLSEIIVNSANSALKIQNNNGSFPPGHNGPWNNETTPARTTAHWAILLLRAYYLTKDEKFKNCAVKAYEYLTSKRIRPFNYSFHCIYSKNKVTEVNGLIGQAWVMESLIEAYNYLKNPLYLELVEDLIIKHYFNTELGLWNILSLNGEKLKVHRVFNQQLWFSVMAFKAAQLCKNKEILSRTQIFFEKLLSNIDFNNFIGMRIRENKFDGDSAFSKKTSKKLKTLLGKHSIMKRAKGYLAFSLYALSDLFEINNSLDIWKNNRFKNMISDSLKYLDNKIFYDDKNEFGFQYNPIGFEVAYIKEVLSEYLDNYRGIEIEEWIIKQLKNHYNFEKMMMNKDTNDPDTLTSRIYELIKVKDRILYI